VQELFDNQANVREGYPNCGRDPESTFLASERDIPSNTRKFISFFDIARLIGFLPKVGVGARQ